MGFRGPEPKLRHRKDGVGIPAPRVLLLSASRSARLGRGRTKSQTYGVYAAWLKESHADTCESGKENFLQDSCNGLCLCSRGENRLHSEPSRHGEGFVASSRVRGQRSKRVKRRPQGRGDFLLKAGKGLRHQQEEAGAGSDMGGGDDLAGFFAKWAGQAEDGGLEGKRGQRCLTEVRSRGVSMLAQHCLTQDGQR